MADRRIKKKPLPIEKSLSAIARELPYLTNAVGVLVEEVAHLRETAEAELGHQQEQEIESNGED